MRSQGYRKQSLDTLQVAYEDIASLLGLSMTVNHANQRRHGHNQLPQIHYYNPFSVTRPGAVIHVLKKTNSCSLPAKAARASSRGSRPGAHGPRTSSWRFSTRRSAPAATDCAVPDRARTYVYKQFLPTIFLSLPESLTPSWTEPGLSLRPCLAHRILSCLAGQLVLRI